MKEHSCGIIPIRKTKKGFDLLLIRHGQAGHWSFPKGHPQKDEECEETAVRELKEETNLDIVRFLPLEPFEESYVFRRNKEVVSKTVTYLAAIVTEEVTIQAEEVSDYRWIAIEDAENFVTFAETKRLCATIQQYLLKMVL